MGTPNSMTRAPMRDEGVTHAGSWRDPCRERVRASNLKERASGSSTTRSAMADTDELGKARSDAPREGACGDREGQSDARGAAYDGVEAEGEDQGHGRRDH